MYQSQQEATHILTAINKPESLRQEVYERIKEAIITNQFSPGQKLDEVRIGSMLGVSRTPVREALNRLAQENLAVSEVNRGVYVARITREDLIEILEIREVLEGLAARLFAEYAEAKRITALQDTMKHFTVDNVEATIEQYNLANVRFHHIITTGCGRQRLINAIGALYDHLALAKSLRLISITNRPKKSLNEHMQLIAAITERDGVAAEQLMREHIMSLREDVIHNTGVFD